MRVQRAPAAADQPPPRPAGGSPTGGHIRSQSASFSAHVDLDLTALLSRLEASVVADEVTALLIAACRRVGLVGADTLLQVLTPAGGDLDLPAATPRTFTMIHLAGTEVHPMGDWGGVGLGVVTLGRIVRTLVPAADDGLSITQRSMARLGITVPSASATAAVRGLDAVARSVQHREG